MLTIALLAFSALAPPDTLAPPVIDVHMHALGPSGDAALLAMMDTLNVRYAVYIGTAAAIASGRPAAPDRLIPALTFPCENGRLPTSGVECFPNRREFPTVAELRAAVTSGQVRVFGELNAQYLGLMPNDPKLEPYYALAEELEVPVGLHMGFGAPGVAYAGPGFPPQKSPHFSGAAGNPLLLEAVLVRHPKLRLYVMHAAWPFLDDMTYMLYMHPQLHVDISVLQYAIPRPAYYRYLRALVDAGFGKRIMFGSDGSARRLKDGVLAIQEADFLSEEQKRDILHDNAARFFRLPLAK
jgi:hypothetical protein